MSVCGRSAEGRLSDLHGLHVWGGSSAQDSTQWGGGGAICLCLCLHLRDTVCGIHVCVFEHVCAKVFMHVCRLDQGAVATAGATSCVFVGQLDSSAVALTLPQARSLDDLLHQLLERTLNTIPGLSTRLWRGGQRRMHKKTDINNREKEKWRCEMD